MRFTTLLPMKNLLWGAFGLLMWWGLSIEPASSTSQTEGLALSFFGSGPAILDRAFFASYGNAEAPAGWMVCLLFALGCTCLLYRLGIGLFPLERFAPKVRLTLFGLGFLFVLLDVNPLLCAFLSRVPANLELLALECGRAMTSLASLVAGLSAALIVSTFLAGRLRGFDTLCSACFRGPIPPLLACSLACAFAIWVRAEKIEGLATVSDELSYIRQADIFANARLSEPSPEPRKFFDSEQMVNDGRYYSKYPPGTALCLSPAALLGISQCMPVLFLGLNLLLTWLLCRRLFGIPTANLALGLASISPFFVSMGESFLSHGPGLFFCLLTFYCQALWIDSGRQRFALFSGLASGIFLLVRPVSAVAVLIPLLGFSLLRSRTPLRAKLLSLALFGLGFAVFAALLLAYNQAQTGDALLNPYEKYAEMNTPYDQFGLENAGQGGINSLFNLSRLNRWLFGFAPSLLLLIPLFVLGAAA
ncbi:MAG: glycosyltransferase family 39 protein, partial [Planctomycetota bacterium]